MGNNMIEHYSATLHQTSNAFPSNNSHRFLCQSNNDIRCTLLHIVLHDTIESSNGFVLWYHSSLLGFWFGFVFCQGVWSVGEWWKQKTTSRVLAHHPVRTGVSKNPTHKNDKTCGRYLSHETWTQKMTRWNTHEKILLRIANSNKPQQIKIARVSIAAYTRQHKIEILVEWLEVAGLEVAKTTNNTTRTIW